MEKNDNRSLTEHRRRLILERLRELGAVRTSELARIHSVSPMTIRNDLDVLARRGHLLRVHGGAMVKEPLAAEPSYYEKATRNLEEKRRIGRKAAELIEEGMAVFIGNGTTTMEIVRALKERPPARLKVFTNALTHAVELAGIPQLEVYVIGGYLRGVSYALVGPLARKSLEGVYFDLAFLGVNGLSLEHGATIPSLEEAETAAEIVRHARRVVIVADHTKFGVVTHGRIADLEEVDMIVTDEGLDPQYARLLSEQGGELMLA
ncbi:DeoR/GlpR transcriptional regulator [Candidatus Bipolaricaulota bacterium]|nr:DeoR/GlpR transcriptional regulator [Candidatus Bipolaricaulota bacterium]